MDPNGQAPEPPKNSHLPTIEESKLFVGGLPQHCTKDSLSAYFAQFGEVDDVDIRFDPNTNRNRGFGFVTFISAETAKSLLNGGSSHYIEGKKVELKVAYKKGEEAVVQEYFHGRKVFVGGLTKEATEDKLREYFGAYGTVVAVDIKKDKDTDMIRGFGFVEFSSKEAVDVLLLNPHHTLCGKKVELKQVEPKERTRPQYKMRQGYISRGGMPRPPGRSNYYEPYGGRYVNNQGPPPPIPNQYYQYAQPPPGPPPGPPAQYGYPPPIPQVPPPPAAPGYNTGDPNQNRAGGVAYAAPPPPVGGQVGYPPPIATGYGNSYDQSAATTGYQQQPAYYDPSQAQQQPQVPGGVAQTNAGYGRGVTPPQRGGYYGGQWTQ